jgi:hypothetical protein
MTFSFARKREFSLLRTSGAKQYGILRAKGQRMVEKELAGMQVSRGGSRSSRVLRTKEEKRGTALLGSDSPFSGQLLGFA